MCGLVVSFWFAGAVDVTSSFHSLLEPQNYQEYLTREVLFSHPAITQLNQTFARCKHFIQSIRTWVVRFLEGIKAYSANTATLGRGGGLSVLSILHPPPLSSDTDISGEVGKALHEAKEAKTKPCCQICQLLHL